MVPSQHACPPPANLNRGPAQGLFTLGGSRFFAWNLSTSFGPFMAAELNSGPRIPQPLTLTSTIGEVSVLFSTSPWLFHRVETTRAVREMDFRK